MKSNLDFYDTPTISRNMYLRISYSIDDLIFENKSCEIIGVKYYKNKSPDLQITLVILEYFKIKE